MSFTENDYRILKAILDKNDTSKGRCRSRATTIQEITDKTNLSKVKIRTTLNLFIEQGFVTEGVKKGKSKTYMLTVSGIQELQSLMTNIIE